jgi:hypothetical protein
MDERLAPIGEGLRKLRSARNARMENRATKEDLDFMSLSITLVNDGREFKG